MTYESTLVLEDSAPPRSDVWVWGAVAVVTASLLWTLWLLFYALTNEPCASSGDQCVLAFVVGISWVYPQLLAALPHLFGLAILVRYAMRGNETVPISGLAIFGANVIASIALFVYLSTLPSYFR